MSQIFTILSLHFVLSFATALQFRWWHQRPKYRHQITNAVNECCPKYDGTDDPIFCCVDELMDNSESMCKDELDITTVVGTINCAQKKFNAGSTHPPTSICHNFCCDFLLNVEGKTKETECWKTCIKAAFAVGVTVKQQLNNLRKIGCHTEAKIQFAALEDCLNVPTKRFTGSGDDDEMKKALQKVCNGNAADVVEEENENI